VGQGQPISPSIAFWKEGAMPSTLVIADTALKIGYGDMPEQLDSRTVALSLLNKTNKHITKGNKEAQFGVRTRRTWGIGARNEYEDLPEALARKTARASVFLKYHYGVIEGSGQTFKQVHTDPQAFVDWMDEEASDVMKTLERDLNRQFYGDGTGTLALLTATATTATSLTLDTVLWLEAGMPIDVLTQATLGNAVPTKGNTAKLIIESVDPATNVITVSGGTVSAAIGSALVLAGNTANNWKKEWEGLGLIVSNTSTLHGINPATESTWKPGYVEASVGTLAEIDLTHLVQGIHKAGGEVTDLLTTWGVGNAYWSTLQGLRRFDGTDKMKGGVDTPVFQSVYGNIPLTFDWACPAGAVYGLNRNEFFLNQLGDWEWQDGTDGKWMPLTSKDAYRATVMKYSNFGVYRRNSFGKLTGVTEV
jgi:hypothetical protein